MSAVAANTPLHLLESTPDSPRPSTPTSPTGFPSQQTVARSFVATIRGQSSPFPTTPTSSYSSTFFDPPQGISYAEFIRTWTDEHIARWLSDIKCGNHASTFKANDIRGDILLELDQTTLQEMGISSIGDRLRILNGVKMLRQKSAGRSLATPVLDSRQTSSVTSNQKQADPATSKLATRGRPAPLTLSHSSARNLNDNLPRLVRDPDSARANVTPMQHIRPLPQPVQNSSSSTSSSRSTPSITSSSSTRSNLPPLPPAPQTQPPLPPPGRPPGRTGITQTSQLSGRRTPTQPENVPAFATQPLPAAPNASRDLLTPSGSPWYGLPSDPRQGKVQQGTPRSTSPLPPTGRPMTKYNVSASAHGRNNSLGISSPITSSPGRRPATSGGHPYANAQPSLLPPAAGRGVVDLSPISETYPHHSSSGTPSPPTYGARYNASTPSHTATTSNDMRKKLVKFELPEAKTTYTVDVDNCVAGVEIIEKVLSKYYKGRDTQSTMDKVLIEDGGLSVNGWSVYIDHESAEPLNEAQLITICHASPDNPSRERPLVLRRAEKDKSPNRSRFLGPGSSGKNTRRASAISILSDLGVHNPERALEPPSPTSGRQSPATSGRGSPMAKRPSKLRNFFGQRPPSELITNHLTEYFPNTEKKVLKRTARQSMMLRSNTLSMSKRDSTMSWIPPLPSRFSSSTMGNSESPTRTSFSSIPPPPPEKTDPDDAATDVHDFAPPRVSVSTEDGRSIDVHENGDAPSKNGHIPPQLLPPIPFPTESFSESLENFTGNRPGSTSSRPVSRAMSIASRSSRRMSYMTELRSKRDRTDTASMMTVDEITAEVENRRQSKKAVDDSDSEWTEVKKEDDEDDLATNDDEEEVDEDEEEEEDEYEEDEEDTEDDAIEGNGLDDDDDDVGGAGSAVRVTSRKANKWIKGALIGAGSFGKVYLGMDASSGLLMAVKQVELPSGSAQNQERKKSMLSALEHEIELLQDLQHENIVQYLYSSLEDDCLNIFLEYVPGGSVTALLRNYGAFEEPLVKNFVRQILRGLSYLHERDIIHRDIKGANILVDNKGGVKISDFGISKKVDVHLLTGNRLHRPSLQGSVFWMAPEVVKQSGHTTKADIWSVGCLVVEMFTGEHPWAQLTQMQAIFKIGSSAKPTVPSDILPESQDFLTRTFEIDHEARPSASELLQHKWLTSKSA